MTYVATVSEEDARGIVADLYARDRADGGFVKHSTQALSINPAVMGALRQLIDTARADYSLAQRDWNLITLTAARRLGARYCGLVYADLIERDIGRDGLLDVVEHEGAHVLTARDRAMLTFADKVVGTPWAITSDDVDALRNYSFTDRQIFDIGLAAAMRSMYSCLMAAIGAEPDAYYQDLDDVLGRHLHRD